MTDHNLPNVVTRAMAANAAEPVALIAAAPDQAELPPLEPVPGFFEPHPDDDVRSQNSLRSRANSLRSGSVISRHAFPPSLHSVTSPRVPTGRTSLRGSFASTTASERVAIAEIKAQTEIKLKELESNRQLKEL